MPRQRRRAMSSRSSVDTSTNPLTPPPHDHHLKNDTDGCARYTPAAGPRAGRPVCNSVQRRGAVAVQRQLRRGLQRHRGDLQLHGEVHVVHNEVGHLQERAQ
jgi:hypothetical protein